MRKSFHTNAFAWAGVNDLEKVADFAAVSGFDGLEVGPMFELDESVFERVLKKTDITAFIYCRNFIDDNEEVANREQNELLRRMRFASKLGVKKIITSTGISKKLSFDDSGCDPLKSLDKATDFLKELVDKAEKLDMYVCLENCPMYRNIATSPYMWERIFEKVDSERLGLCYDAGHFVWQFIDPYKPLEEFSEKIHHLHLKDTKLYPEKLNEVGILHNTGKERGFDENQWWRHTIIGDGEIDYQRFLGLVNKLPSKLLDVSFEMEDHVFECVPEKVETGLNIQLDRYNQIQNLLAKNAIK